MILAFLTRQTQSYFSDTFRHKNAAKKYEPVISYLTHGHLDLLGEFAIIVKTASLYKLIKGHQASGSWSIHEVDRKLQKTKRLT